MIKGSVEVAEEKRRGFARRTAYERLAELLAVLEGMVGVDGRG